MFKKVLAISILAVAVFLLLPLTLRSRSTTLSRDHTLNYYLNWTWGAAQRDADGSGWQVVTDLGYQVHVESGSLVAYSTQLIECPHEHPTALDALDLINTAEAGHGSDGADPSALPQGMIENLAAPGLIKLGTVTLTGDLHYCQAHYLIARTDSTIEGMSQTDPLWGVSLYLTGTYQQGNSAPVPFTLQTSLANGKIADLDHTALHSQPIADVIITRRLDTLFNGLDFATMESAELGKAALWNLIADLTISLGGQ